MRKTALGCLAYLGLFAALAVVLDRWTAPWLDAAVRPWVGVAVALQFTLAIGALWTALLGVLNRSGSRAVVLALAAAGTLPDQDGVAVVTGTVRAATLPLQAPLSGTPCVAYSYRMFHQVRNSKGRLDTVPVFWGLASRPFIVDTRARAVRVMAVPWLQDDASRLSSPDVVARARQYVASTRFEEAAGLLGAVGSVFGTVRVLFTDDDGEHRADYRSTDRSRRIETLLLEESVLPVGARASVAGSWSTSRGAIIPSGDGPSGVTVTMGPIDSLLKGNSQVPASATSTLVFALVLGGLGAASLWAAVTWLGPGLTFVPR